MLLQTAFWMSTALLGYVYFGYPFVARVLARKFGRPIMRRAATPSVSVVITAYNEEAGIRDKLDNVCALNYPVSLLEIIVASDASSDGTDSIVRAYPHPNVRLLRIQGRKGKTACQNAAAESASGEIVVFTDATTRIDPGALESMVANFSDSEVGCVAGSLVYESHAKTLTGDGGTAYWSYEIGLRQAESSLGSLVGVSGCLYAVRKSAYRSIPANLISDFVIALRIREHGLRTVLDPSAVCFEETHERSGNELSMRIRVAIRSINALVHERRFLNPFRYGAFCWQLWSHKLLRYASPYIWLLAFTTNAFLLNSVTYQVTFAGQCIVLSLGAAGFLAQKTSLRLGVLRKPYYFLLTNVASFIATLRYVRGERMVTWKPVR